MRLIVIGVVLLSLGRQLLAQNIDWEGQTGLEAHFAIFEARDKTSGTEFGQAICVSADGKYIVPLVPLARYEQYDEKPVLILRPGQSDERRISGTIQISAPGLGFAILQADDAEGHKPIPLATIDDWNRDGSTVYLTHFDATSPPDESLPGPAKLLATPQSFEDVEMETFFKGMQSRPYEDPNSPRMVGAALLTSSGKLVGICHKLKYSFICSPPTAVNYILTRPKVEVQPIAADEAPSAVPVPIVVRVTGGNPALMADAKLRLTVREQTFELLRGQGDNYHCEILPKLLSPVDVFFRTTAKLEGGGEGEFLLQNREVQVDTHKVMLEKLHIIRMIEPKAVRTRDGKTVQGEVRSLDKYGFDGKRSPSFGKRPIMYTLGEKILAGGRGGGTWTLDVFAEGDERNPLYTFSISARIAREGGYASHEAMFAALSGVDPTAAADLAVAANQTGQPMPANPPGQSAKAPTGAEAFNMPGELTWMDVGGQGRYLVMWFAARSELALFDTVQRKIVQTAKIPEGPLKFAAGREHLLIVRSPPDPNRRPAELETVETPNGRVVINTSKIYRGYVRQDNRIIEIWDLKTLQKTSEIDSDRYQSIGEVACHSYSNLAYAVHHRGGGTNRDPTVFLPLEFDLSKGSVQEISVKNTKS